MTFREYLKQLLDKEDVKIEKKEVDFQDIPFIVLNEENGDNRPILFNKVAGYPASIVANLFGSQERINQAVSAVDSAAFFERIDLCSVKPHPLRMVEPPQAEYDVVTDPDLKKYVALVKHSRNDSTPYLTSGVALARHPTTGCHHLCFVRLSVQGGNKLLFNPATPRISDIVKRTIGQGKELEIAIIIGAPLEVMLMACLSLPEEIDELQVAQALGGSCLGFFERTLPVPVSTEYILIGRVLPEYQQEGPFGDSKGLYSERSNPVCMIQEMWQRKNPIFHLIRSGTSCEHVELLTMKAKHYLEKLKRQETFLLNYQLPVYAGGRLCLLTMDEGCVAKENILEFLFNIPLIRCYILLNKDVDPNSAVDILWALTHRATQPSNFKFQGGHPHVKTGAKTVIDATTDDPNNWNNRRIQVFKVS